MTLLLLSLRAERSNPSPHIIDDSRSREGGVVAPDDRAANNEIIGAVGDRLWLGVLHFGWDFHPLSLIYAVSGSAMISATLKIPKP